MSYRLKPYNEVEDHNGISEHLWNKHYGKPLHVFRLTDNVSLVHAEGEYLPIAVNPSDIFEITNLTEEIEMKTNKPNLTNNVPARVDKSVIRNLCTEVMTDLAREKVDFASVVIVAEAFGRLLNKIPENN